MKALLTLILAATLAVSLWACGCSNGTMDNAQTPGTTLMPDILPTIDTNIPDPEVDTQMPIYTEGTDGTTGFDTIIPSDSHSETTK